jgi:putative transposase
MRVARSIDAEHTARALDQIVRERGAGPELVRMDNGPEMTATPRATGAASAGPSASSSSPARRGRTRSWSRSAPVSATRCSRSRHSTPVLEAQTVISDWRTIYNHRRPHSSLGWRLTLPMPLA